MLTSFIPLNEFIIDSMFKTPKSTVNHYPEIMKIQERDLPEGIFLVSRVSLSSLFINSPQVWFESILRGSVTMLVSESNRVTTLTCLRREFDKLFDEQNLTVFCGFIWRIDVLVRLPEKRTRFGEESTLEHPLLKQRCFAFDRRG